jgi:homoserine dehydrogenase
LSHNKYIPQRPARIGVGMLGLGVVGSGVAEAMLGNCAGLSAGVGRDIDLRAVLVRDLAKRRRFEVPCGMLATDPGDVVGNPDVDIVVEVMGGERPALDYILKSISLGKHVVTANKEVMARHGREILAQAARKGVRVMFEASVAGGTPIIAPLARDLVANKVLSIHGIINGTTNYILDRMAHEGVDFDEALREAQELGYAEAEPSGDVDGTDAAYKLAILSSLAFRTTVKDTDVYREGIRALQARDFSYAGELGYAIKLLATARRLNGGLEVRVHPALVPHGALISRVDGVMNAVEIETDLAGRVLFHGRGAGSLPTASAVVADIVQIARDIVAGVRQPASEAIDENIYVLPMSELETSYYLRMEVADRPGVLASIATVLGNWSISIDSVVQKQVDVQDGSAELVLTTHRASESSMQQAMWQLLELDTVREIGNMLRLEEWGE